MAAKVYACLLGEWVDITDYDTHIGSLPVKEWLEKLTILKLNGVEKSGLSEFQEKALKAPFVEIYYKGRIYSISPTMLQIVR